MENRLKEIIAKSGLKKSFIASKIGVANNTFSCYISGRRNPTVKTAEKIADILNCSVEDIFFTKNKLNYDK